MYMHVWLFFWPGVIFIEKLRKGHCIVLSVADVYNMVVHLANCGLCSPLYWFYVVFSHALL